MTWNYRIVHYKDGFGLHEVYYDAAGLPWGMTDAPVRFTCDDDEGPAGIIESLKRALKDARERPVFDVPADDEWPGNAPEQE